MLIDLGYEIAFDYVAPTAVMACMLIHPSRVKDLRTPERFYVFPNVPWNEFVDLYGNRCIRLFVPAGRTTFHYDAMIEDSGLHDPKVLHARQHPVEELPDYVMHYLLASRYCDTDSELVDVAYKQFSHTPMGWMRVQAICDFVNKQIKFNYMHARANRTAAEAYREKIGVCRDYTHLAIAFCRIMNIPARYCTGFLGDIGVPLIPPMDFSAWFEVYLGGQWYTFDARNNIPRIGRVLMGSGRDAADVALTTSFGLNTLGVFNVRTDEVVAPGVLTTA